MLIGYARISTTDQHLDLQITALEKAGCKKIYKEQISGKALKLPELEKTLTSLKEGDILVVRTLDRLGRTLPKLLELVAKLTDSGVGFKSLKEAIDLTTSFGRFSFNALSNMAEFEHSRISAATKEGLASAKARGVILGRPKGSLSESKLDGREDEIGKYLKLGLNKTAIAKLMECSRPTLNNFLKTRSISKGDDKE